MRKVLAFDIGGTFIKCGVISDSGSIIRQFQTPTEAAKGGKALMSKLISLTRKVLDEEKGIAGVGVSTGGQVSPKTGEVLWATDILPGWTGMKVKEIMEKEFNLPVFVDNDANAAALGEKWAGSARGVEDFLFIIIGTGLGGAIVLNGEVYRGSRGSAGEWGHTIIHKGGLSCTCGGKGCFEQYASFTGIVNYIQDKSKGIINDDIDAKMIFQKAAKGDLLCQEAVDWFIDNLALGIGNLLHVFNPSLVILGGNLIEEGEEILERVRTNLKVYAEKYTMPSFMKGMEIKFAECGNNAGILGAAYGCLKN